MSAQHTRGEVEEAYATRDYAQSTSQQIIDACGPTSEAECVEKIIEASRESERAERDLQAQETMARWTLVMGAVAGFGLLVSLIGVGLVYITFQATQRAAKYSGVAARQARQSLMHIKDTTAKQLRPYIALTESGDDEEKPFSRETFVKFRIKNFGQTPATNVRIRLGAWAEKVPVRNTRVPLSKGGEFGLLAPNDQRTDYFHVRDMPIDFFGEIASGRSKVLIRIRAEYDWEGGTDSHDLTFIMPDPSTGKWHLLHDDHLAS